MYTKLYEISKFRDTAIQNPQNLQRNIWTSGHQVTLSTHFFVNFHVFE